MYLSNLKSLKALSYMNLQVPSIRVPSLLEYLALWIKWHYPYIALQLCGRTTEVTIAAYKARSSAVDETFCHLEQYTPEYLRTILEYHTMPAYGPIAAKQVHDGTPRSQTSKRTITIQDFLKSLGKRHVTITTIPTTCLKPITAQDETTMMEPLASSDKPMVNGKATAEGPGPQMPMNRPPSVHPPRRSASQNIDQSDGSSMRTPMVTKTYERRKQRIPEALVDQQRSSLPLSPTRSSGLADIRPSQNEDTFSISSSADRLEEVHQSEATAKASRSMYKQRSKSQARKRISQQSGEIIPTTNDQKILPFQKQKRNRRAPVNELLFLREVSRRKEPSGLKQVMPFSTDSIILQLMDFAAQTCFEGMHESYSRCSEPAERNQHPQIQSAAKYT